MFKKPPQTKGSANIKSSERRHLLADICKEYDIAPQNLSKEDELALLPSPIKQASFQTATDKGTIFFDSAECPVWFKTRDSPVYPTLHTLWKAAYLLPIVLTNSFVIKKLTNHANLMLPGCIPPFDARATSGALVGVACYENPSVIMAIGHCCLDMTKYDSVVGTRATAVAIFHSFDDFLFRMNDVDVSVPEEVQTEKPGAGEEQKEGENLGNREGDESESEKENNRNTSNVDRVGSEGQTSNAPQHGQESGQEPSGALKSTENSDQNETDTHPDAATLSVEDTDNFFVRAFIQSVKNNQLEMPMAPSKFMADYVLKNFPRTDPKFCSIKRTSWKKTAKYLKALDKLKYVSLKGKGDDVTIVAITISLEIVAAFVPHKTMADGKGSSVTPSKKDLDTKLNVVNLYKPGKKCRMVLSKVNADPNALYEKKELADLLKQYIDVLDVVDKTNRKMVVLDEALQAVLGKSEKTVARDKLLGRFVSGFAPHYVILKPKQELSAGLSVHKGEPPKIRILTKSLMGRKKSTAVLNFEPYHMKAAELAEDLKTLCSGSTSVGESINNPNVAEVMVQGAHGPTIIEYLKKRGVPIGFIDFEDKSKGKKK